MKNTVATFRAQKGKSKLTMVTAYDALTARAVDECGIHAILVGDSLGMVVLGLDDTLGVTLDDMLHHCRSVARGAKNALLVCDMPFLTYQVNKVETVHNAGRLIQDGHAHAVKLEGGVDFADDVRALTRASIPVMGHIGLTPQSVLSFGGFKVQGKSVAAAQKIVDDARAIQDAGAFSIVLEGIPARLGAWITKDLEIPTIGIGAGADCDGQVLVVQDLLGITEHSPKFVKRYAELGETMRNAFQAYKQDVEAGKFPESSHFYTAEAEEDIIAHLK